MTQADALLAGILERPEDPAPWLVMSDWLEEQGDPADSPRVELLRIESEWLAARDDPERLKELTVRAEEILARRPKLLEDLIPPLDRSFPVLSVPSALAMFLLADRTSVVEQPFAAGTTWEGALHQAPYAFPTIMQVRERRGNRFAGDMKEDFSSMYGSRVTGTFYFRGVIVGRSHVAFATYRTTGAGVAPGLYQFRLNRLRRLNGTWQVGPSWGGAMWLKQKRD
jgi:uncharacterized protein (TIGR02996 family)